MYSLVDGKRRDSYGWRFLETFDGKYVKQFSP
jgi:hypothetical protein